MEAGETVSTSDVLIFLGAFLACAVELVEALTIVLGVGVVRGWRSTLIGVGTAGAVLVLLVALWGPALQRIPIQGLRLVVGALLLAFGLQWLKKAILRSSGYKALHDEDEAFRESQAKAAAAGAEQRAGLDWYSFTVAFKGVLLEGLEVVFIVIAFGSAQGHMGLAVAGATAALVVVLVAGVAARGPLSRVPENTIKFAVGLLLTTLRVLLGRRGRRGRVARRRALAARGARVLRARLDPARALAAQSASTRPCGRQGMRYLRSFGRFWWNFVVGDDWRLAAGVAVSIGITALLSHQDVDAWWLLPVAVAFLLAESLRRAVRTG